MQHNNATTFLSLAIVTVLYILIDRIRESIWKRFKVDRLFKYRRAYRGIIFLFVP
jgi:hypothetical protein